MSVPRQLLRDRSPSLLTAGRDDDDAVNWKVICIGDMGVGKTAFLRRVVHGLFTDSYKSTIGVDFLLKRCTLPDGELRVNCQLWDIAGQERFGNMTRVYFKQAIGALIFCDDRLHAYESLAHWKQDVDSKAFLPDGVTPIPALLVINKMDAPVQEGFPSDEEIDAFVLGSDFIGWTRTSARTGEGCDQALMQLLEYILQHCVDKAELLRDKTAAAPDDLVDIGDSQGQPASGCRCNT